MNFSKHVYALLIIGVLFVLLDSSYLYLIKDIFELQVASIQRVSLQFKLSGAILCYLFLILGLYYFIILPHKSASDAFLFGLIIYGVYESTNYAIFKKWKPEVLVMDTLWGGVVMSIVTYIVYKYDLIM